jgi:uncharacterized protein (TIRG00374 family)
MTSPVPDDAPLTSRNSWRRAAVTVIELVFFAVVVYKLVPRIDVVRHVITTVRWPVVPLAVGFEAASLSAYAELDLCALRGIGVKARRPVMYLVNISGAALGKVLPGGTIAAMPFTTRMLEAEGADPALAVAALAGSGLLASVVLAALLPVAALVAMASGFGGVLASSVLGVALGLGAIALLVRPVLHDPNKIGALATRVAHGVSRGPLRRHIDPQQIGVSIATAAAALLELTKRRATLRQASLWAAASWMFDFAALVTIALSVGRSSPLAGLPLAYVVGQLAAAVPLTPGGVGVVEATMTAALVAQGSSGATAAVTVLGWRLVSHWLPIAVGLVTFLLRPRHHHGAYPTHDTGTSTDQRWREPLLKGVAHEKGHSAIVTPDPGSAIHDAHRETY